MRVRIGFAIASDSVRAIAVRGGEVLWAGECPVGAQTSIEAALREVAGAAKVRGWPRMSVSVAVGPSHAQTKRLVGLPPVTDPRAIAQMVHGGAGRFFLRNGTPLVTTDVRVEKPGEAWAAAIEEPVVAAVERACRSLKLRVRAIAPTVAVLGRALEGGSTRWIDGEVAADVMLDGGRLTAMRRVPVETPDDAELDKPRPLAPLAKLGADGWRFADAYGAAMLQGDEPLVLRRGRAPSAEAVPRWRVATAASIGAASLAAALLAPGLSAARTAHHMSTRLAALASARQESVAAEADLRDVTRALGEVGTFDAGRRSALLALDALARALPKEGVLVAVRFDSAGGMIVALAPRAAALLPLLERVPGIVAPEIVGPVTREFVGARERERVTVRFRWDMPAARSTLSPARGAAR